MGITTKHGGGRWATWIGAGVTATSPPNVTFVIAAHPPRCLDYTYAPDPGSVRYKS